MEHKGRLVREGIKKNYRDWIDNDHGKLEMEQDELLTSLDLCRHPDSLLKPPASLIYSISAILFEPLSS